MSICFYPMFFLDPTKFADLDIKSPEDFEKVRKMIYEQPTVKEQLKILLPQFLHKGFLG